MLCKGMNEALISQKYRIRLEKGEGGEVIHTRKLKDMSGF